MKLSKKLVLAASAITMAGSIGLAAGSASAVTEHCDATTYPNKVNIDGGPTVATGLAEGTEVCIKSGTKTAIVFVDGDGNITNDTIRNRNGVAQGISYYAFACEYPCGGPSS